MEPIHIRNSGYIIKVAICSAIYYVKKKNAVPKWINWFSVGKTTHFLGQGQLMQGRAERPRFQSDPGALK